LAFPSLEEAGAAARSLFRYASDISDGRPTLRLSLEDAVKATKDVSPNSMVIAAHVWTPYFGLYGSKSGYDSIYEAFGKQSEYVDAVETGLSASPDMCRRYKELDDFPIVSFSDAHNPRNIGREATAIEAGELSYGAIKKSLRQPLFTIEFFPQEGKYYHDGHRRCGYSCDPHTSRTQGNRCPKCGRKLTVGVLHRVESLADRPEPENASPFFYHVPLVEVISRMFGKPAVDPLVQNVYHRCVTAAGSEFRLMYMLPCMELEKVVSERILEAVKAIRKGSVEVIPGYDGVYGEVKLWNRDEKQQQMGLFK